MARDPLEIWWEIPQSQLERPSFWEGVGAALQTLLADLLLPLTFELDRESGV